ncbi:MAG: biotin--[acetyl-CoA-carboxylase] ligase [Thermaceae bacterium]|nr:biotin--[acetyl-CoA-carboxylase] ligase [Thermaceae bacterium]
MDVSPLSQALLHELIENRGELLQKQAGFDPVALSEAIKILEDEGYPLNRVGAGYRLAPGTPTPQALKQLLDGSFGQPYSYQGRLDSTQDAVRRLALEETPEGAVVLAERQEQGRGRRGRAWASRPGQSLTFSVLLRPRLHSSRLSLLSLAAGLAVVEACALGGLKWPNDLLAPDGRKLAGVLLEAQFAGEHLSYAVLGIGLNIHRPVPEGAAALEEFGQVSRVEVLARILQGLEARYQQLYHDPEGVLRDYRAKSYTLGHRVRVMTSAGAIEGEALEVASDGSLVLKSGTQTHRISAGDVQMVGRFSV